MIQLYINGQLADLLPDTVVAMTFQVNDIAELRDRQASYSNRIKLPKSKVNNNIFEQANVFSSTSQVPYNALTVNLIQEGVQTVTDGIGVLDNVSDVYELIIYSGAADFFRIISERDLNDIDLSAYNHEHVSSEIIARLNTTEGYIYPIIDYGLLPTGTKVVDAEQDLFPALYLHTIIKSIITDAGFTYSGDVFTESDFLTDVIAFTNDELEFSEVIQAGTNNTFENSSISFSIPTSYTAPPSTPAIDFGTQTLNNGITFDNSPGNNFFEFSGIARIRIIIEATVQNSTANEIAFQFGSLISPPFINAPDLFGETFFIGANQTETVTINYAPGVFSPSEVLRIYAQASAVGLTITNISCQIGTAKDYVINTLPDISQSDMLKFFMQKYCVVASRVSNSNEIRFFSMNEVTENIPIAKDWSDKLDVSSIQFNFNWTYAQNNYFRWADDESVTYNGNGTITSNNQNLPTYKTVIESIFAASDMVERLDGLSIAEIEKYEGTDFTNEVKPRILKVRQVNTSLTIDGTPVTIVSLGYFVTQNEIGLNWTEIIARHYGTVSNMLNDTKLLTAKFRLYGTDVQDIDFSIPIYIDYFGKYFYLNKANNYVTGRLTTCQLIKL